MAVKTETIIKKMKDELNQAETHINSQATMQRHIANVHLLCDLLLDTQIAMKDERPDVTESMTEQEIKAMIGTTAQQKKQNNDAVIKSLQKSEDIEGNGDSIFDF